MEIYVGNLSYNITETDLRALFSTHGSVLEVNLISDYFTRQSKCFAYVLWKTVKKGLVPCKLCMEQGLTIVFLRLKRHATVMRDTAFLGKKIQYNIFLPQP